MEIECDSWCGDPAKGTATIYGHFVHRGIERNGSWQLVSRFMVCGEMANTVDEG